MAKFLWDAPVTGLWSDPANWASPSGGTPGITDSVQIIDLTPDPFTVAITNGAAAFNLVLDAAGGQLLDLATLRIGNQLRACAGTLTLARGALLEGGTISLGAHAQFLSTDGTLAGLTWRGPLDIGPNDALSLGAGVNLESANGGPGTVRLGGVLDFRSSTIFGGTLAFGVGGYATVLNSGVLDFAPGSHIELRGEGSFNGATVVNDGLITAAGTAAGFETLSPHTFLNNGTIQITNRAQIRAVGNTDWTNAGQIAVTGAALTFLYPKDFLNTGVITLSDHASFRVFEGSEGQAGQATNNGTIRLATGSSLIAAPSLAGTGTLVLGLNTEATLLGPCAQTADFVSSGATLSLYDPQTFRGLIADFGSGDVIDLPQTQADALAYANHTLTLTETGTPVASLHFLGSYHASEFQLSSDGTGGTLVKII